MTTWLLLLAATSLPLHGGGEPVLGWGLDAAVDNQRADAGVSPDAAPETASEVSASASGRLRGRVLAKGSRAPVPLARIDAGLGLRCDSSADGSFELPVPCGLRHVTVRAPGFAAQLIDYDACAGAAPLLLRLVPHRDLPHYETVVLGQPPLSGTTLQGDGLVAAPGSLGDPFRAVESLPGVASVAWPMPVYAIRGANPGNTGFFLDDVPMPALFHLALGPAVIHPYFLDSMTFYPGGYPARYGRYVSGLVSVTTRAPAEDRGHAAVDMRLYDVGALAAAPWPDGNGGVAAAFRYSYAGPLLRLLRNDLRLSYWDYQARADRRIRAWHLRLLWLGSGDSLSYLDSSAERRSYVLRFHRVSLRAQRPLGAGQLLASLTAGSDGSQMPIVQNYPLRVSSYSLRPRLAYQRPTTRGEVEVGVEGAVQWYRPTSALAESGASDLGHERTAVLGAAYASTHLRVGDRWTLTPGLRLDSYRIGGTSQLDLGPRLSARFRLEPQTWLTLSGGRFSQPPSLVVQIPGADNFGLGLYGLQTSWQAAVGIGSKRPRVFEVEVTAYVQRYVLADLRDPVLVTPDPLADNFLVRRDARAYGVEVMLRRPLTERLHGWLAYTLSQSQRALEGGVIGPSDWDQRHVLNAVLGYRVGGYTLGARGHVNSGRPVLVDGEQAQKFVRLPAFYQLDLRIERRILFDVFTLDVFLEVANATATRQVLELKRQASIGQPSGVVAGQSYRLVLPSLGVHGEF